MNILDTDVLSHLQKGDPVGEMIRGRLAASTDHDFWITSVSAYEMIRGAVDLFPKLKQKRGSLIPAFDLLQQLIEYLAGWKGRILPYDAAADSIYLSFDPRLRQHLGDDARIAAIARAKDAAVWTHNTSDFLLIPGLVIFRAETGDLAT